jgi:DNA-binding HxlR family transcriptional regulator
MSDVGDKCALGMERGIESEFSCSVDVTLSVIGGKWKLLIYNQLQQGASRFGHLRRALPRITQTVLATQLRELERDGIVSRTIHAGSPPGVEYALTDFGRSLQDVLDVMARWGEEYHAQVVAKRTSQAV